MQGNRAVIDLRRIHMLIRADSTLIEDVEGRVREVGLDDRI